MTDEQAIAARLTAIAERLKALAGPHTAHDMGYLDLDCPHCEAFNWFDSDERCEADLRFLLAHVETLTQQVAELTVDRDAFKDSEREALKVVAQQYAWRVEAQQAAAKAEQDRDAARAALMEIRVEAAMGAYTSDGTIGGGLTASGCLDIVSACDAALQSVPPVEKGWQPIATAPKDGTSVLVRAGKLVPIVSRCRIDGQWRMQFDAAWSSPLSQPTHWMPLPPAPAQDGTGDIP